MTELATAGALDASALDELAADFRGPLVRPGDPTYEADRKIWNGSIDRRPALIARCTGVADVMSAVRFARRTGVLVAVRGGGHSFPGHSACDDGLVIDLSLMKGIRVDPEARTARVEPGVLLGELDRETQAFGQVVPAGIVTHTGVAGLTLGGGIGHTMRAFGLTIDQLLSVDLVTASGDLVRASERENADLFWGVRGGGGNFGIVTSFEFRTNPMGPIVLAGPIVWAMEDSPEVLRFYRDWITDVPDELTTMVVHRRIPTSPMFAPELHGRHAVMVICTYAGPIADGERVVRPMREFGTPLIDLCEPKPFVAHQAMLDPSVPHGRWYYFRSLDVATLTDEVIDITVEHSLRMTSPINVVPIFHLGGSVARVGNDETAFNSRGAGHTFNLNAASETADGFEEQCAWSRNLWDALSPYQAGVYVNFLLDEGEDRIRQAYGAAKYDRLKSLKRAYDPDNMFRLNQNISPD